MIDLFPAIDLRGGRAVRLHQGDYGRETVYGDDPVALAIEFVAAGARWVHVVDLDAARGDGPVNRATIAAVAVAVAGRAQVQTGGGVRTIDDVRELAAVGVARVVMGSAAVRDPELVSRAAGVLPVAVGLDHRAGVLAVQGWTESAGIDVAEACSRYPEAAAFVVTDISRDGTLVGPDLEGLAAVAALAPGRVVASGGVSSLEDLRRLRAVPGLVGVVVGKALYEGRFGVAEALSAVAGDRA